MASPFLDTNVLLRHLLQDDPEQSPKSTAYLARIERGEVKVRTADTVVFETVFTLQRQYGVSKTEIRDNVLPLLELPGVSLPGKRQLRTVFDLYVDLNLSFIDAYHAVLMKRLGLKRIVSFDKGLDRVPGITRVEPNGDWRHVALAWLAVALRSPGRDFDMTELEKAVPGISRRLLILPMSFVDVSGTAIREWARKGVSLDGLVPPAVESYIKEHALYTS